MYLDPRQQRAAQLRTIRQRKKKARIAAVAAALRTHGPQAGTIYPPTIQELKRETRLKCLQCKVECSHKWKPSDSRRFPTSIYIFDHI